MSDRSRAVTYRLGSWRIDLVHRELRASGARVPLGSKASDIMEVLVRAPDIPIDKDELVRRVWPHRVVDDNTLQVHISAVRKALGEDHGLIRITSERWLQIVGHVDKGARTGARPAPRDRRGKAAESLLVAMTELIGREAARQQIADLLSAHRLVTLVGPRRHWQDQAHDRGCQRPARRLSRRDLVR